MYRSLSLCTYGYHHAYINACPSQSSRLACFSSIGPTSDGRIKPDVVAPGDFLQSAFSGDPSLTQQAMALGSKWEGGTTCAVHQMSGTSMATPVTG